MAAFGNGFWEPSRRPSLGPGAGRMATPLIINVDETCLPYHFSNIVGTILRQGSGKHGRPGVRAKLSQRRDNLTYLAAVCSDPALSHLLPQVLLGNCSQFSKKTVERVRKEIGKSVLVWRENTAWTNQALMKKYIALLCESLEPFLAHRGVHFLLDMASSHIHDSIVELRMEKGVRAILVPAGLTSPTP